MRFHEPRPRSASSARRAPRLLLIAAVCAALIATHPDPVASGTNVLLDVDGVVDAGQTIDVGEAVAVSFTVDEAFTDVAIAAPIHCFGCHGSWTLIRDRIGPTASFGDVLGADWFDASTAMPLVTSVLLSPDDYFLVLAIDAGFAIWPGSLSPAVTQAPNVFRRFDFRAATTEPFPAQSDFDIVFDEGAMHFVVYQTGPLAATEDDWGKVKSLYLERP
jgi:hypothetical protein